MNFEERLKEETMQMEEVLKAFLPKEEGFQKTVIEAMNYSVLAGGKRLHTPDGVSGRGTAAAAFRQVGAQL